MFNKPLTDCIQARESISAQLDQELPEFERERLTSHLRDCGACTVWAEQVEATTLSLRSAPVEAPSQLILVSRRSRRRAAAPFALAAAAAASLVAVLGSQSLSLGTPQSVGGKHTSSAGSVALPRGFDSRRFEIDSVLSPAPFVRHSTFRAI